MLLYVQNRYDEKNIMESRCFRNRAITILSGGFLAVRLVTFLEIWFNYSRRLNNLSDCIALTKRADLLMLFKRCIYVCVFFVVAATMRNGLSF